MKITMSIEDVGPGKIRVTEERDPEQGESKSSETTASMTADVLFLILSDMDSEREIIRDNLDD